MALTLTDIEAIFARRGGESPTVRGFDDLQQYFALPFLRGARQFIARPHATEAVQIRMWDDHAKAPDLATPSLSHFLARAQRCMLART